MCNTVQRGHAPNDRTEFGPAAVPMLHRAAQNLYYLLNQGYPIKGAVVFVGNHYLLSERQRTALVRAISSRESIENRKNKEFHELPQGSTVHIDGFNTIITLEVALSGSLLLKCMDGTVRDLAALRGSYRLIDKTSQAILMIGLMLERNGVSKAVFYLDSPISNSGRLKEQIGALLKEFPFELQFEVIHNVDVTLENLENVITSDAIILDKCKSWFNLNSRIISENIGEYPFVDFAVPGLL
ncbi:MAG: DUF434 domain-containing protein [Acetatifactor sp.]|nr:DUF434 domain-containing protein [Acetatifactor sp.]